MSGSKVLLDTNAFIYFFEGRQTITDLIVRTPHLYFSVISEIELLSANHLSELEIKQIKEFLSLCNRIELTSEIVKKTIALRRQYRLKTPDAIIAATSLSINTPLVSADVGFQKIAEVEVISDILT